MVCNMYKYIYYRVCFVVVRIVGFTYLARIRLTNSKSHWNWHEFCWSFDLLFKFFHLKINWTKKQIFAVNSCKLTESRCHMCCVYNILYCRMIGIWKMNILNDNVKDYRLMKLYEVKRKYLVSWEMCVKRFLFCIFSTFSNHENNKYKSYLFNHLR